MKTHLIALLEYRVATIYSWHGRMCNFPLLCFIRMPN